MGQRRLPVGCCDCSSLKACREVSIISAARETARLLGSVSLAKDRSSAGVATSLLLRFLWQKKEIEVKHVLYGHFDT